MTDRARVVEGILRVLEVAVALTALAGGAVLVVGALQPQWSTLLTPPTAYLSNSPFDSYLIPGIVLAAVLGGTNLVAFVLLVRRSRWSMLAAVIAAYATVIWIFVQMVYIPFSVLQVIYLVAGLAQIGLVLVLLGLFRSTRPPVERW